MGKFFVHYGLPEQLMSDQGRNFESDLIAELCALARVKKIRTTPYRPESNGQCERFNSTLIAMLGTLPKETKSHWPEYVSTLVHAYNCSRSKTTGFSPYFLMYGRHPLLPIDIEYGVRTGDLVASTTHSYVQKLQKRLEWAYKKAQEVIQKESARSKRRYDRKICGSKLHTGDLVLVRQKAFKGKHKIQDRWENEPYKVIQQIHSNIPVYKVKKDGEEKIRTLHRNMLFPIAAEQTVENTVIDSEPQNSPETEIENQEEPVGPITRSRAKAQLQAMVKANKLMEAHFGFGDEEFVRTHPINVLTRLTRFIWHPGWWPFK